MKIPFVDLKAQYESIKEEIWPVIISKDLFSRRKWNSRSFWYLNTFLFSFLSRETHTNPVWSRYRVPYSGDWPFR